MAKNNLKNLIGDAVDEFAKAIVDVVKSATLEDLINLQAAAPRAKPGRKPGPKPGRKAKRKPGPKPGRKLRRKPGPKPKLKPGPKPKLKPGPKPKRKPGPKPKLKPGPKPKLKPGPKPATKTKKAVAAKPLKKKRVVKNYPQCAFPKCNSNRFPRGKGFCGEHWRMWLAGKIKDASTYKPQ